MSFKIGVVGGTRGVGKLVVEQALERGWTVNALARNPVAPPMNFANDRA